MKHRRIIFRKIEGKSTRRTDGAVEVEITHRKLKTKLYKIRKYNIKVL